MGAQYDGLGNYIGYTNDDGTWWSGFGESSVSPTSVRPDLLPQVYQDARQRMQQLNNDPAYKQFTPEQVQQYTNFKGSAADLLAMSSPWSPFEHYGIYNDNVDGNGPQNMWFGPEAGPQHNDSGPEQFQTAWNDMRNGLAIMALPFAAAGGAALVGGEAAGAGAVGAGAAEGGAAAGGVDASTGLFAGESATSGAAGATEGGVLSGGAGSGSLVGGAGSDTMAGTGETGAFDTGGSQGVFDSAGNGLYESPSVLQYAQGLAQQYGITPATALSFIKNNAGLFGGLLGLGAGAVGGGAKPAGTTTTTQDLPAWLKPYAQGNVAQGSNILSQLPSSAPLLSASQTEAMKTINGDYLNPASNPYFASSVNDALGLAKSQFAGMYGGQAGSNINNSGFQEGLTRTLGQLATNAYSTNYQNERNRQATATFGAPQFASQSAAAPFAGNQAFAGLFPNVSSTSVPYFQNNLGNMFSGAVGGAVLGKAVS